MAAGELTLVFGGDTSIGVNCEWMFRGVDPLLAAADLRMVQLEEPFVARETEAAGPDRTTAALAPLKGRIDLVTLSGNHFYDLGEDGVRDTLDWCRENGIAACGGALLSRTAVFARDLGLTGLEFAHGIPGSVGGAVVMNAGAYGGEMKDVVIETAAGA